VELQECEIQSRDIRLENMQMLKTQGSGRTLGGRIHRGRPVLPVLG